MSLITEFQKFIQSKEAIKTSIVNKGQSIRDRDAFYTYAEKIVKIPNGKIKNISLLKEVVEGTITDLYDDQTISLRTHCLQNLYKLRKATFTNLKTINPFAFQGCIRLSELILSCDWMVNLISKDAFRYTKLEHYVGGIYVPENLLNEYIEDKEWSKLKELIKPITEEIEEPQSKKLVQITIMGPVDYNIDDIYFMN